MSKQPPPAPTASAVGPCPTIIQIVGRPGTGSLPRTIAPPDHPYGPECMDSDELTIRYALLCRLISVFTLPASTRIETQVLLFWQWQRCKLSLGLRQFLSLSAHVKRPALLLAGT